MDTAALATSTIAVFTAGIVTSFHCVGMCGPLACSMIKRPASAPTGQGDPSSEWEVHAATGLYHLGRVFSYAMIGGILGLIGASAAGLFDLSMIRLLPWVLAAVFLIIATGLDHSIPKPVFLTRFFHRLSMRWRSRGPLPAAGALGLASPFLPCAPLYIVFGVALFANGFFNGFFMMAVFALGTIPFYWLVQYGYLRLAGNLSPNMLQYTRQGLAFASAAIIIWRALLMDGSALSDPHCPFCPPDGK